jgi:hypothetical protein
MQRQSGQYFLAYANNASSNDYRLSKVQVVTPRDTTHQKALLYSTGVAEPYAYDSRTVRAL